MMLSRAAPRLLRAGAAYAVARPVLVSHRFYAAKRPPRPPPTQPAQPSNPARSPNDSEPSNYSSAQEEFRTAADPSQNTAPQDAAGEGTSSASESASAPLHDLTKGLPSTIAAELESAEKAQDEEDPGAARSRRGSKMPPGAYETSAEKRKNAIFSYSLVGMGLSVVGAVAYLGRNWADDEEERQHANAPSGWGPTLFYNRVMARMTSTMEYYNEPAFPKLLPDPDPAWERPYTLVISLEDMLIHNEWTREHGWRLAKRPGVDYFLRYLSQYYEIVIFTSMPSMFAEPVIRKLDPFHIAMWPLFREATRYTKGKYVKDLSFLNRDLSKVILVDTDPSHASLQPENAIILPKWDGSAGDKQLVSLIPFLEYVAALGLGDTRKVLDSYKDADSIPSEFARREAKARERFNAELSDRKGKKPKHTSGMGFVGKALGIKSGQGMIPTPEMEGLPTLSEGFEQGMMLHDQIRLRGQRQYQMIEKEIRENGEKWLKELAADEEKMKQEAMKDVKTSFTGWFGGSKSDGGDS